MLTSFLRPVPVLTVVLLILTAVPPSTAQDSQDSALLFAYTPKDGQQAAFEEGYRQHLKWHDEKDDELVWYGWNVVVGQNAGMFVDGTFGNPIGVMDSRVAPAEDVADFAETTAPFADIVYRRAYRLRTDLSTATPLEDLNPSRLLEVVHFTVKAGRQEAFERVLRTLKANGLERPVTWYELVVGGRHAGYLLFAPRSSWSDLDEWHTSLDHLIGRLAPRSEREVLRTALDGAVREIQSEIWAYRPDLSYFPDR